MKSSRDITTTDTEFTHTHSCMDIYIHIFSNSFVYCSEIDTTYCRLFQTRTEPKPEAEELGTPQAIYGLLINTVWELQCFLLVSENIAVDLTCDPRLALMEDGDRSSPDLLWFLVRSRAWRARRFLNHKSPPYEK